MAKTFGDKCERDMINQHIFTEEWLSLADTLRERRKRKQLHVCVVEGTELFGMTTDVWLYDL